MVDNYSKEVECFYKGECYSVRDNGAIMRHVREGKKVRDLDGKWTFGSKNLSNGYMYLSSHRVHIIVANAFLGEYDSSKYVVDHIDTNRCNNRVENLRLLTRLENALLNEITRNKIKHLCGSIEAFIENPNILASLKTKDSSLEWMKTVTKEEAENAYFNIKNYWNDIENKPKEFKGGKIDARIYSMKNILDVEESKVEDIIHALSPNNAWQLSKNWKVPVNFLCCPKVYQGSPLKTYFNNLKKDAIFTSADYFSINDVENCSYKVLEASYNEEKGEILVLSHCNRGFKNYGLTKIIFNEDKFIHENLNTFHTEEGARKYYTIAKGLEWTGGDTFDDYCM